MKSLATMLIAVAVLGACSSPGSDPRRRENASNGQAHFSLNIQPGPRYFQTSRLLFIPITRPSISAAWVEGLDGKYVSTIFVSRNAAADTWYAHPEGQPGALPVWRHAAAQGATDVDAASGATPKAKAAIASHPSADLAPGSYIVKFEINQPYDYNDTFPANLPESDPRYSGANGQPSLVYQAQIEIGKSPTTVPLALAGTGAPLGADGDIHGLEGLSTSKEILRSVSVGYRD